MALGAEERVADWKSAIRQVGNLRYYVGRKKLALAGARAGMI
jgi:hypothetical protein